jgi:cytosine/adenosine deaminase-related metal-dependent hydrolase
MAANHDFAQLLEDFMTGGVVVVDQFPAPDDDVVAFRTLIQPGGDVCLSIHPRVLERADFKQRLTDHQQHVHAVLDAKRTRLRRLATLAGVAFGTVGGVGGLGVGYQFDLVTLVHGIPPEVMLWAAWFVGGVLFGGMRDVVLRVLLRHWAYGRVRLRS